MSGKSELWVQTCAIMVRSVRTRLLVWLLGGVLFVGAAGGWLVYRNALGRKRDVFFDYHLRQTALLLSDQPVEYLLNPDIPQTNADFPFVVQDWSLDGIRVYLSRPHAALPVITRLGFSTAVTSEGRWRVFGVQAPTQASSRWRSQCASASGRRSSWRSAR